MSFLAILEAWKSEIKVLVGWFPSRAGREGRVPGLPPWLAEGCFFLPFHLEEVCTHVTLTTPIPTSSPKDSSLTGLGPRAHAF